VALVGLAPQEVGGIREIARLVQHEQRLWIEMVEAG